MFCTGAELPPILFASKKFVNVVVIVIAGFIIIIIIIIFIIILYPTSGTSLALFFVFS